MAPIFLSPSGYAYYPRSIRANNTFKSSKYLTNGLVYETGDMSTRFETPPQLFFVEKLANKLTRASFEWNSMFDDRTLRKEDNYSPLFYPLLWLSKYLPIPLGTR